MSQLENDRQSYINYIEEVAKYCELDHVLEDMETIKTLSFNELHEKAKQLEKIYISKLHGEFFDHKKDKQ